MQWRHVHWSCFSFGGTLTYAWQFYISFMFL
jgi:hypothetical protein